jgi:hypothetical protein
MTDTEEKETLFLGRRIETIFIRGLTPGLRTSSRNGRPVQVLTLSDTKGIKWELHHPWLFRHDPNRIALFRRNTSGKGFHLQRQHDAGTRGGLHQLLQHVEAHERRERESVMMRKPNPITTDYVQPARVANLGALGAGVETYATKYARIEVRPSASVLVIKNRTGGRNRKERRGS